MNGYERLEAKIDHLQVSVARIDVLQEAVFDLHRAMLAGFSTFEKRFEANEAHLDRFEEWVKRRFDSVDLRFDAVDRRFDSVDAQLEDLRGRVSTLELKAT